MEKVNIISYLDQHAGDFRKLNLEWLDKYHLTESHDLMVLEDPRGTIINNGGVIFLAECDGGIIGSAALMKQSDSVYELAKMTVDPDWRGKGVSRLLIQACLDAARLKRARKITLFSNHQLVAAIALYEKYGFRHVAVEDSPFATADVKMELIL